MKQVMKAAAMAAAAAMACVPVSAQAAGCWNGQDVAAAKVRDLQTMLMVATLRCRASGLDLSADYNNFVSANRLSIATVNQRLKAHFSSTGGASGQEQYDHFTTALANVYGDDETGGDSCEEAAQLSRAAASAGSVEALIAIADSRQINPQLPGGTCAVTLASNEH